MIIAIIKSKLFRIVIYLFEGVFFLEISYTGKQLRNFDNLGIIDVSKSWVPNSYLFVFADKMHKSFATINLYSFI